MKSRSLAALSVSVVFAISGIPAYAGEAEADPFGKYEETLDVHFVRATDDTIETYALGNLPGQTLEDNFWLDTYRDELGINVVYDWIVKGDDEYSQKINITIATGELPDIMSVTATQMVQLAEADLIADISDVYEAYAADFTKETLTQEGDDPFLGIWRGNPRPFNDRDESAACFYHTINPPKV